MNTQDIFLLMLAIFVAVAILVFLFERWMQKRIVSRKVAEYLTSSQRPLKSSVFKTYGNSIFDALMDFSLKLSLPDKAENQQRLLLKFLRAGIYVNSAFRIYFGVKGLLTIGSSVVMAIQLSIFSPTLSLTMFALYVVLAAAIGYYLPNLYLHYRVEYRKRKNQDVLADFVDLLIICIEAGMGLDAALSKIQNEFSQNNPIFSRELHIANLEIRAGSGRNVALKNLALRIDLEDLRNLVTMLVQVDQFGTSVANSLRIHSAVMRTTRMQRAEQIAGKIPVKMLVPMTLCIFPGFLVVILGSAVIQITNAFR